MLHINKVKRILRAKNGSQIPKFQNGGSPYETIVNWYQDYFHTPNQYLFGSLNSYTNGVEIPTNVPDTTNDLNNKSIQSPTTQQFQQLTYGDPKLKTSFETLVNEAFIDKKQKEYLKMSGFEVPKLTKPVFQDDIDRTVKKAKWREFKTKAGDFISKNAIPIGMGLDYIGSYFDNTTNSKGFDTAMGGLDTFGNLASTIDPKMGLYTKAASTLIKGANDLLGEDFNYKIDNNLLARSGASYSGHAAEANRLASKSGKIGFWNFGKHSSLENKKRDLNLDAGKISDVLDANDDKLQASRNDLIYTKYNNKVSGLDNKVARFNKQGGKLVDKISLIKSRNLVKQYINSDTLQIEEYAKGGTLDWEPVIEVFEPVIEIPEFQKGGQIEEQYDFSQESEDYPQEYKDFKNSLPKNQRLTPESEYRTYLYWQLWGKPKNFQYTLNHPDEDGNYMYTWDDSDRSYHGNSIAWKDGMGYFIKPKDHPTLKYELDYYNKGLITEEGGKQRPAKGQELKDWQNFKNNYNLVEDGNFYKYAPKLTNKNEWEPTIEILDTHIVGLPEYKSGGKTQQELETPEIEETTQKNIIPEGALHKNKHHIEHTEGLTKKGIPVVDNEGNQQAEVEKEEIIFSLEVTKKLEELYKDYYDSDKSQKEKDEAAIEAGKLLVYQILFNTDDRTGLIKRCEEGGKL